MVYIRLMIIDTGIPRKKEKIWEYIYCHNDTLHNFNNKILKMWLIK